MDRAILHDIRNELAVATGTVHAFIDRKMEPTAESLARVLESRESVDGLLTEMRAAMPGPARERLLQAIVEGSPYAKILVDASGHVTLVNGHAEALFGYTRDELLGQSIDMLVPARFRRGHPELRKSFNEAPVARPMGAGRELFGRRSDGSEFPIEIGLNPIETDAGSLTLATISDITERKRAEELRLQHAGIQQHAEEIEALNEELAAASRFKSQFVATMSHELRTPLTAIIGSAELLERTNLDERAQTHVTTISESAEALLALIGSVLDFSKIEAGRLDLQSAPFAVDAVLEGAAEVVAQLAREKGLAFHTYVDPAIPAVLSDADRLRQVLLNLLGNAVKFTERGSIVARAFPLELSAHDVLLRFEVEDTGIGIAPEVVPNLFEPFVQADQSSSRKYDGTGLGLSISKRIVELMGGEFGIQSKPGSGSLFWFTARFERSGAAAGRQTPAFENVAGLIVSSDEVLAQIVARYMNAWGLRSHHARTRPEMHAALQASTASTWLAIVDEDDFEVPGLREVIDAVHALAPARVIVLGGGSLRKPIRQSYLFDAIVRATDIDPASAAPPVTSRKAAEPSAMPTTHTPVLVAEDNTRLQSLLKLQFDELGIPVTFVSDGAAAVEAVRTGHYAMVFMDCQMPNMDGLAATRAIRLGERETGRHVPITAMTANAFAEDREACLAAGMDDYLSKPVRLNNLRAMIERWTPASR
jgi:PAS domain S-box-containing protein